RLQAYLAEVQGSARLRLPDGSTMGVGNQGVTDYPFVSLARLLAADQKLKPGGSGMASVGGYFREHPEDLGPYLARCRRMAFFRDTGQAGPGGALEIPITAQCSVAS